MVLPGDIPGGKLTLTIVELFEPVTTETLHELQLRVPVKFPAYTTPAGRVYMAVSPTCDAL